MRKGMKHAALWDATALTPMEASKTRFPDKHIEGIQMWSEHLPYKALFGRLFTCQAQPLHQ